MGWLNPHNVWLVLPLMFLLSACTPHYKLRSLGAELAPYPLEPRAIAVDGYRDLRGVIHVHSEISHDSEGTADEIIQAAREANLDFIIMTDHDSPEIFTRGMQGWYDGISVIRGMEITKGCRGRADRCASLLAVGLEQYFDHRPLSFQQVAEEVERQGGMAIVAHPQGWPDWSVEPIAGMEIYDLLDDAMDRKWKFPKFFFDVLYSYPEYSQEVFLSIQDRPKWHLGKWDELTRHRSVTGIAGNDAHQNVTLMGRQVDPYSLSFRYVTTHVLAPELGAGSILSALKAGHAYVAFDLLADSRGFWFGLIDGESRALMGDERAFSNGQVLTAQIPLPGLIVLFKDGQEIERCPCVSFSHPVRDSGVYRVEVYRRIQKQWRLWILSNPVYLR